MRTEQEIRAERDRLTAIMTSGKRRASNALIMQVYVLEWVLGQHNGMGEE